MQITVLSGTNRPGNLSLQVAHACREFLGILGKPVGLLDLKELPREIAFDYLEKSDTTGFDRFQAVVDATTHFVFVVPEYNGSIPGILKLFIDACAYPASFRGKSALLVGLAAGKGGNETGLGHLEDILHYFGMHVHPQKLTLPMIRGKVDAVSGLSDATTKQSLEEMLLAYVGKVIA